MNFLKYILLSMCLCLLVNKSCKLYGDENVLKQNLPTSQKSDWNGFERFDFKFEDRAAILVLPKTARADGAWVLRPAFFGAFANADAELLKRGFFVAYLDVTHMYGSPKSMELLDKFYNFCVNELKLSKKVTLEGLSRGGAISLLWANHAPEKIACVYVDAPVCDYMSWPVKYAPEMIPSFLKEWNIQSSENFKNSPIDNLSNLAKSKVAVLSICGDSDKVVPHTENTNVYRERFVKEGGNMRVVLKKGVDHHPHGLSDPTLIVDFIERNQPSYKSKQYINVRGDLNNSQCVFENKKEATVAFLGGSITEMNGWRNAVQEDLKYRFPNTKFNFIDAGISSTGSTPGAFRLKNDILDKGKIDLLFVEAAVNDDTNGFSAKEQIRGMEGIIRNVRSRYPEIDIIMQHFIYDPFIEDAKKSKMPDVFANHESVAKAYDISSINQIAEISRRMSDEEFTWEEFGGTHPKPFGHKFYASAVAELFDKMYSKPPSQETSAKKNPPKPLDKFSYYAGDFYDIKNAKLDNNWKIYPHWKPFVKTQTRKNFVDVEMLATQKSQATLSLEFDGCAIGMFCVAGADAGIIEYSIDNAPFKEIDTFTLWSSQLYLPWVYMFATELENKKHTLVLRTSANKNPKSKGNACVIRNFVVSRPSN